MDVGRGSLRSQAGEVLGEPPRPVTRDDDVVVQEGDPRVVGGEPATIACGPPDRGPRRRAIAPGAHRVDTPGPPDTCEPVRSGRSTTTMISDGCGPSVPASARSAERRGSAAAPSESRRCSATRARSPRPPTGERTHRKQVDRGGPEALQRVPGESTIGRPAVLKLVLTTTGTPVRRSNAASIRCSSGSVTGSTVWMRAVPSTWVTADSRSRHPARRRGRTTCTGWERGRGRRCRTRGPRRPSGRPAGTATALHRIEPLDVQAGEGAPVASGGPARAARIRFGPGNHPTTWFRAIASATASAMSVGPRRARPRPRASSSPCRSTPVRGRTRRDGPGHRRVPWRPVARRPVRSPASPDAVEPTRRRTGPSAGATECWRRSSTPPPPASARWGFPFGRTASEPARAGRFEATLHTAREICLRGGPRPGTSPGASASHSIGSIRKLPAVGGGDEACSPAGSGGPVGAEGHDLYRRSTARTPGRSDPYISPKGVRKALGGKLCQFSAPDSPARYDETRRARPRPEPRNPDAARRAQPTRRGSGGGERSGRSRDRRREGPS